MDMPSKEFPDRLRQNENRKRMEDEQKYYEQELQRMVSVALMNT